MRTPNLGSAEYSPAPVPEEYSAVYIQTELGRISAAITALALGHIDMAYVAPTKPRKGDIRIADGTSWNPGGTGKGVYWYDGTTWIKL